MAGASRSHARQVTGSLIAAVLIVIITITVVAARIPAGGLNDDIREERYKEQQRRREDRLQERQEQQEEGQERREDALSLSRRLEVKRLPSNRPPTSTKALATGPRLEDNQEHFVKEP